MHYFLSLSLALRWAPLFQACQFVIKQYWLFKCSCNSWIIYTCMLSVFSGVLHEKVNSVQPTALMDNSRTYFLLHWTKQQHIYCIDTNEKLFLTFIWGELAEIQNYWMLTSFLSWIILYPASFSFEWSRQSLWNKICKEYTEYPTFSVFCITHLNNCSQIFCIFMTWQANGSTKKRVEP